MVALFSVAIHHEMVRPSSGIPMTVACGLLLLGSALLSFAWCTATVGIYGDRIEQYYFGWRFKIVRFEEIGRVELASWGYKFRSFAAGHGPYLVLRVVKKGGGSVDFDGFKSAAWPQFSELAARFPSSNARPPMDRPAGHG